MMRKDERTYFLGSFLARHFEACFAKLTKNEKRMIARHEVTILHTYQADQTEGKKLFYNLLDTLEEMNDLAPASDYRSAFDWLLNIWDEIAKINHDEKI